MKKTVVAYSEIGKWDGFRCQEINIEGWEKKRI